MPEFEVKDKNNNIVGKINVADDIFQSREKSGVIHDVVVNYRSNQRQGTHSTKTKGLVRGGGRKPWRQKHTGRARAGSIRSPLWKGGGTIFGPHPRGYGYKLPKKIRKIALMAAFNKKLSDGEVIVLDGLSMEKPRTKDLLGILNNLELTGKSVLIILPENDESVMLSARNIPGVNVTRMKELNTYNIVVHQIILITKDVMAQLEGAKNL